MMIIILEVSLQISCPGNSHLNRIKKSKLFDLKVKKKFIEKFIYRTIQYHQKMNEEDERKKKFVSY